MESYFLILSLFILLISFALCFITHLRIEKSVSQILKSKSQILKSEMFDDKRLFSNDLKGLEARRKFFLERVKSGFNLRRSSDFYEVVIVLARIELERIDDQIQKNKLFLKKEEKPK